MAEDMAAGNDADPTTGISKRVNSLYPREAKMIWKASDVPI
jgi:hypothetical protein